MTQAQQLLEGSAFEAAPQSSLAPGARRWMGNGLAAMLDQGVFAISGFATNILLARWLSADAYGLYSVAFMIFLLGGLFHTAFLSDPMVVFSSKRYRRRMREYLTTLVRGQTALVLTESLALLVTAGILLLLNESATARTLFCLAMALPFMLALWLVRRACYVVQRPGLAALGGMVQLVGALTGLCVLRRIGLLDSGSALVMPGMASGLSFFLLVWQLRLGGGETRMFTRPRLRVVMRRHWRYGRWVAGSSLASYASAQLGTFVLSIHMGLSATAEFRALTNLLMPAFIMVNALVSLWAPHLAQRHRQRGFGTQMLLGLATVALCVGSWWFVIGITGRWALAAVYQGRFAQHSELLWIAGLQPLLAGLSNILGAALAAQERSRAVFLSCLVSCTLSTAANVHLVMHYQLYGAILALVVSSLFQFLTLGCSYLLPTIRRGITPWFVRTFVNGRLYVLRSGS
jgi:O-antigen/teichoic acid export membrane protein